MPIPRVRDVALAILLRAGARIGRFPVALSCHDFVDNQVRPQLFVLAYNLGELPAAGSVAASGASLDIDAAARETNQDRGEGRAHSRKIVFQMAEVAVPR